MHVLRVAVAPFAILNDLVEYRPRLASAMIGAILWSAMYTALYVTQLIEKIGLPRFIVIGLIVIGIFAWRGLPFSLFAGFRTIIYTCVGLLSIWLLWELLNLREVLPLSQPRPIEGSFVDEPPERLDTHFFSFCYVFALPLAMLKAELDGWLGMGLRLITEVAVPVAAVLAIFEFFFR